jgi:hypothetical protein
MRRTMLSFAILVTTATAGLHCAYADATPGHAWGPRSLLDHRAPASDSPRIELVDDGMHRLPTFRHEGRRYVLGETDGRYVIRIVNPTASRVEAVVSVDGLDAVDGHPANLGKRGYIVSAYGEVTIDGWRTSLDSVAAFRFSSVRDSYAARTGNSREVGVIGVAFFRERPPPPVTWRTPPPLRPLPSPQRSDAAEEAEGPGSAAAGASKAPGAEASRAVPSPSAPADRPGLGTQFGEARQSSVVETTFVRAESRPMAVAELRYDDRDGLVSRGIAVPPLPTGRDEENELRDSARAFPGARFAQPPP